MALGEYAYVQLPLEAGGGVARLRRWLYGMRQAASAWVEDYAKRSATTVFWHPESGVRMVVCGDDFTIFWATRGFEERGGEFGRMVRVEDPGGDGP